jgi:hypothetical protein
MRSTFKTNISGREVEIPDFIVNQWDGSFSPECNHCLASSNFQDSQSGPENQSTDGVNATNIGPRRNDVRVPQTHERILELARCNPASSR